MTVQLTRRSAVVVVVLLATTLAAGFAAYSYGESTRMSDREVSGVVAGRVSAAVATRSTLAEVDQKAAVKKAKRGQRQHDMRKLRTSVRKAEKKAFARGQSAGYSSGNAAGFTSGSPSGLVRS